jgi:hypothetical protein
VASLIGKQLAQRYDGDLASTDWRHLGRLAGFTYQKPQRRDGRGHAPWVKVLYARAELAAQGTALVQAAHSGWPAAPERAVASGAHRPATHIVALAHPAATGIYVDWLHRLRIPERFPQPDWSIADKWIAKELLRTARQRQQSWSLLRIYGSWGIQVDVQFSAQPMRPHSAL